MTKKSKSVHSACCCIVLCNLQSYNRLQSAYHLHHWKDEEDNSHSTQCFIYPVYCVVGMRYVIYSDILLIELFIKDVKLDTLSGTLYP